MIEEIGEFAGVIWRILAENEPMTLSALKRESKGNDFMVHAAIGWLAREGKLESMKSGRGIKIGLK
ncbi:MAG: winged helix-turn-helix domain-containing protein [candidate division KSB1 bacterium]|jgi:hypothetical protein|nr:winged helix-turn-helix domain-containing protein [candidate division KSB1 bacterium]